MQGTVTPGGVWGGQGQRQTDRQGTWDPKASWALTVKSPHLLVPSSAAGPRPSHSALPPPRAPCRSATPCLSGSVSETSFSHSKCPEQSPCPHPLCTGRSASSSTLALCPVCPFGRQDSPAQLFALWSMWAQHSAQGAPALLPITQSCHGPSTPRPPHPVGLHAFTPAGFPAHSASPWIPPLRILYH